MMKRLLSLASNVYFWGGLGALVVVLAIGYVLFNSFIMPVYTRQEVSLEVPNVRKMPLEEAQRVLASHDLRAEVVVQRFNPNFPPNVVVDQTPRPELAVKPNRRIYLTINSGSAPTVTVPRVEGISMREARNRLKAAGLEVGSMEPDTIPSPYENTITRQSPASGSTVTEGATVNLWYSTGLGTQLVTVPDVTGSTIADAQRMLLRSRLRSVVVRGDSYPEGDSTLYIIRQSREPGTQVREGFEVRLYLDDSSEEEGAADSAP